MPEAIQATAPVITRKRPNGLARRNAGRPASSMPVESASARDVLINNSLGFPAVVRTAPAMRCRCLKSSVPRPAGGSPGAPRATPCRRSQGLPTARGGHRATCRDAPKRARGSAELPRCETIAVVVRGSTVCFQPNDRLSSPIAMHLLRRDRLYEGLQRIPRYGRRNRKRLVWKSAVGLAGCRAPPWLAHPAGRAHDFR